jgi:Phage integrase family
LAAVRAGVGKIGWHTFRHSYSSLLRRVGADIKVQQELLRHSTIQSTMNVYTQAMSEGKRAANSVIVRSVLPDETCGGVSGARCGSQWEPMGTEKSASGCGGWI